MYMLSKHYNLSNCQNNFEVKNISYFEILTQNAEAKYFEDDSYIAMSWEHISVRRYQPLWGTYLVDVGLACIKSFPLDYMHLVCLGVVKRIIYFWKGGPSSCRSKEALSYKNLPRITLNPISFRGKMPPEHSVRRNILSLSDALRSHVYISHRGWWKAT